MQEGKTLANEPSLHYPCGFSQAHWEITTCLFTSISCLSLSLQLSLLVPPPKAANAKALNCFTH